MTHDRAIETSDDFLERVEDGLFGPEPAPGGPYQPCVVVHLATNKVQRDKRTGAMLDGPLATATCLLEVIRDAAAVA